MIDLTGSPYSLESTAGWVFERAARLHERVELLRSQGHLTQQTLRAYFGDKRFEQIAESNAIEGSTLGVGETQMAVLRGITITGHDPAYSADAVNLSRALERVVELAQDPSPTSIDQVKELHSLVLGEGAGAGLFRSTPVIIAGSPHEPPSTWDEVMSGIEDWERWSVANADASALLRAVVLHAWLTHIHPFTDGNGRTSRAVMNLELVRGGFPSVIIRRKDRLRYYEALAESDLGGNLELIAELILLRAEDALRDLERAATAQQGYDKAHAELLKAQERQAAIWNDAVRLLFSLVEDALNSSVGDRGTVSTRWYDAELSVDDYAALSQSDPEANSWLFRIDANVPGLPSRRFLAWTGFRSYEVRNSRGIAGGPSIFWSMPDPAGNRMWFRDDRNSPGVAELTLELPNVDRWIARLPNDRIEALWPSAAAQRIATAVVESIARG
ncbi:Fic family protein [Candidatus Poriferisodalis sp.]|uniref:Fic family protein n=1 Tax=Candidatus Poriferisodalis sp. TaxID=3101277 RepID=UPI003B52161B